MSMLNVFQIAGSALNAQSLRLNTTASNLANADSVVGEDGQPYRAKQVVFAAKPVAADPASVGVQVTQVVESAAPMRLVYEPGERRGLCRNAERQCGRGDGEHDLRIACVSE
jgi:flagellar basal-body rod protein FlgC